jgi:hypothetical protein
MTRVGLAAVVGVLEGFSGKEQLIGDLKADPSELELGAAALSCCVPRCAGAQDQ